MEHLLARLSNVVDQNTKVLDLVANHMIRDGPGASMPPMPSSTVQDADDETTDDETAPMTKTEKPTKMFRGCAQPTSHKNTNELHYRVSFISRNEVCCINTTQDKVRKHANKTIGRTCSDKVEPALEKTVLKYKHTGKNEVGPSIDLFQPDFSERFPEKSPWNIHLAEIFANDYAKSSLPSAN
jgi:hypothetical protein